MSLFFGVDPGLAKTGWGLVKYQNGSLIYIRSDVIKPKACLSLASKLKFLHDGLVEVIIKYQPDFLALEKIFVNKNPGSSLNFAYARGAILLALTASNKEVEEITPNSVKKTITGDGHAAKEQVKYMITEILNLKIDFKDFDCYDALALAVCMAYRRKN